MRLVYSSAEPASGLSRRSSGRLDALLLGLVLCVPIPLLAVTGLAIPLPTGVVEAFVSIVPGGGDAAVRVTSPASEVDAAAVPGVVQRVALPTTGSRTAPPSGPTRTRPRAPIRATATPVVREQTRATPQLVIATPRATDPVPVAAPVSPPQAAPDVAVPATPAAQPRAEARPPVPVATPTPSPAPVPATPVVDTRPPAEPKPVEPKPVEPKPVDSKPADPPPVETSPGSLLPTPVTRGPDPVYVPLPIDGLPPIQTPVVGSGVLPTGSIEPLQPVSGVVRKSGWTEE